MSANASLKKSGADAVEGNRTKNKRSASGRKPRGASYARLSVSAPSHRLTRGTRLLVTGAWILVVIQVLAIAGDLIHAHVRNPSIDAFLSAPSSRNIAGTLGLLVGTTLPGMAALLGGLSLRKRTNHQVGKSLIISATLAMILVALVQFMPTSNGGYRPALSSGQQAQEHHVSTPSMRLAGRWRNVDSGGEVHYRRVDPNLGVGTYKLCNPGGRVGPAFRFKVVSEDVSGTTLLLRDFKDSHPAIRELSARLHTDFSKSDILCNISKDGRQMTQEYVANIDGSRSFCVYQKVGD